jgi:hypothetical protein
LQRNHRVQKGKLRCIIASGLLGLAMLIGAASQAGQVLNDTLITRPFHHHVWQDVLTQAVKADGEVDFARLRAFPKRLNEYLDQLAAISPESDPSAFPSQADKTAYWINAHNAIALRLILDHYPVTSLNDVPNFEQNSRYALGGKLYSLSQIRSKVAAYRHDPHVLFDLTDYTYSAPPILPKAYEGNNLKLLTRQALQSMLTNPRLMAFERTGASCVGIKLSPYFKNYEQALFSASPGEDEDRDVMAEPGMVPVSFQPKANWRHLLQPYAPPALYSDLDKPACPHQVTFMPADKTLRQVQLP